MTEGYRAERSQKRSRERTTEPLVEFSKGMTPYFVWLDWTEWKMSGMVRQGVWV